METSAEPVSNFVLPVFEKRFRCAFVNFAPRPLPPSQICVQKWSAYALRISYIYFKKRPSFDHLRGRRKRSVGPRATDERLLLSRSSRTRVTQATASRAKCQPRQIKIKRRSGRGGILLRTFESAHIYIYIYI